MPLAVGDQVDPGDLPVLDRELEGDAGPSTRRLDELRQPTDQGRPRGLGTLREGVGRSRGTPDFPRGAQLDRCVVGQDHDVGIEHREKGVEVAGPRRREERV
ncbi:MAG: hypothetical protein ACREJ0_19270, partial [Geminicoccaceae bacterium]